MNTRSEIVAQLSTRRRGVVTAQELLDAGIPKGSIQLGVRHGWTRLCKGIWLIKPEPPDFYAWLEAGRLLFGEDSIVGGAASLFVRNLLDREPKTIEFWTPADKRCSAAAGTPLQPRRDYINRLERRDSNAPFSSIADSLCDFLNNTTDTVEAASTIINCRKRAPRLALEIHEIAALRKRLRHRDLLEYLFNCEPAFDSVLEYLWVLNVEVPHGIPPSTRQWKCPDGYMRDAAWINLKAIVELDGDAYHNNQSTMKRDRAKNNAATRRGFTTYRFSYADVNHHACSTAATLAQSIPGLPVSPCNESCWVNNRPPQP